MMSPDRNRLNILFELFNEFLLFTVFQKLYKNLVCILHKFKDSSINLAADIKQEKSLKNLPENHYQQPVLLRIICNVSPL